MKTEICVMGGRLGGPDQSYHLIHLMPVLPGSSPDDSDTLIQISDMCPESCGNVKIGKWTKLLYGFLISIKFI